MTGPHRGYWFECRQCGFLASSLVPAIGDDASHEAIDETRRRQALDGLRHSNFECVLDAIQPLRTSFSTRLLDVGCAHGWFLRAAARRGYLATGLEPDATIATEARRDGHSVISGFFPGDLPDDAVFDVITFHDVFEHLPSPREAAAACFQRLSPGGLLVLVLPSSKGTLFRLARLLSRFGLHGPLDRLWQRGFPSPHLTYFHPDALDSLLQPLGFREVHRATLPSFTRKGLWQRLRYDQRSSFLVSVVQWLALGLLSPMQRLLPSDISFQVFVREDHAAP
ncbi:MAG TPA: class I SAM-dependent methyltransferase [Thermoanaerobaculia bacterium]|nr:class I SAM-dependent methyltransferase [Thermoanaerobaculia bacterium]